MTDEVTVDLICLSPTEPKSSPNGGAAISPPPEKIKCFLALGLSLLGTSLASSLIVLNNDRVPRDQPPLPDIVLEFSPSSPYAFQLAEFIVFTLIVTMAIVGLLHQHRWIVFRRLFVNMGLLYIARGLCLYITTLPNPKLGKECALPATSLSETWTRVFALFSRMGLSVAGQNYCGDLIFSGHSSGLIGLYLYITEYTPPHQRLLRSVAFILSTFGVFLVLVSREHYTIDVLVAYYLCTRLHWTYHTIANIPALQKHSRSNLLCRNFLHPIVVFFEGNVGGPVPNEFISLRELQTAIDSVFRSGHNYRILQTWGTRQNAGASSSNYR